MGKRREQVRREREVLREGGGREKRSEGGRYGGKEGGGRGRLGEKE